MRFAFVSLLGLASLALVAADCVTSATPINQKCPTTAQSLTYFADGSCGTPGIVTLVTMPGLCAIEVNNGLAVGLPTGGNFTGTASETDYNLAEGNWTLLGQSSDPQADPSSIQCAASSAGTGEVLLKCSLNECIPSGDDCGFQCTPGSCVEHLGPVPPDGGFVFDAGVDGAEEMDGATEGSAESGEPADSGELEAGD
jgi:hypothetical protein